MEELEQNEDQDPSEEELQAIATYILLTHSTATICEIPILRNQHD